MIITIKGELEEIHRIEKSIIISEKDLRSRFWTNYIKDDTEVIIVNDVTDLENVYSVLRCKTLTVEPKGKEPYETEMPNVIIVKKWK